MPKEKKVKLVRKKKPKISQKQKQSVVVNIHKPVRKCACPLEKPKRPEPQHSSIVIAPSFHSRNEPIQYRQEERPHANGLEKAQIQAATVDNRIAELASIKMAEKIRVPIHIGAPRRQTILTQSGDSIDMKEISSLRTNVLRPVHPSHLTRPLTEEQVDLAKLPHNTLRTLLSGANEGHQPSPSAFTFLGKSRSDSGDEEVGLFNPAESPYRKSDHENLGAAELPNRLSEHIKNTQTTGDLLRQSRLENARIEDDPFVLAEMAGTEVLVASTPPRSDNALLDAPELRTEQRLLKTRWTQQELQDRRELRAALQAKQFTLEGDPQKRGRGRPRIHSLETAKANQKARSRVQAREKSLQRSTSM